MAQLFLSFPSQVGGLAQLRGGRPYGPLKRLRWDSLRVLVALAHDVLYVLTGLVLDGP